MAFKYNKKRGKKEMKKTKLAIVSAALMLAVTAGCVKPQPSTSSSSTPAPSTSSQAQSG